MADFPLVPIHLYDNEALYNVLDWQRVGAKVMLRHFIKCHTYLQMTIEQCRYFHVPVGNLPKDSTAFGADLLYARHLKKQNFLLWVSPTEKPDLGGKEADDNRLMTEAEDASLSVAVNEPGAYKTVCVEIEVDALAVNTLLQVQPLTQFIFCFLFVRKSLTYPEGKPMIPRRGNTFLNRSFRQLPCLRLEFLKGPLLT